VQIWNKLIMKNEPNKMIIYSAPDKGVEIEVKVEDDTVWLSAEEIAELFGVNRPAITKHLSNIYKSGELQEKSTCSILEHVGGEKGKERAYRTKIYNLDAIISIGYRVNSKKATHFRVWATNTLRDYLVNGYAINQSRLLEQERKLLEIQQTVALIKEKSQRRELMGHESELLDIINEYTKSLVILNKFDQNKLKIGKVNRYIKFELNEEEYKVVLGQIVTIIKQEQSVGSLFGKEAGNKIKGILGSINQTFDGKELYNSVEEKAAHLLYFIIKDHPYGDGNKRIGSMLFLYFLQRNGYLYGRNGELKINDNTIVALALLIAVSEPKEKENVIKLLVNLIRE